MIRSTVRILSIAAASVAIVTGSMALMITGVNLVGALLTVASVIWLFVAAGVARTLLTLAPDRDRKSL